MTHWINTKFRNLRLLLSRELSRCASVQRPIGRAGVRDVLNLKKYKLMRQPFSLNTQDIDGCLLNSY
jgi:hypothetical protein